MQTSKPIYNKGASNDFMIRIFDDGEPGLKGKVEHIKTGQVQYFDDYLEMLMMVQQKLDEQGYPQSDTELRTFDNKS